MKKNFLLFFSMIFFLLTGFTNGPMTIEYQDKGIAFQIDKSYEEVDKEVSDIVNSIQSDNKKIRIFVEDTKNLDHNAYINYSNKQLLLGKANFKLIAQKTKEINGYTVKTLEYYRPDIKNIENDKSCYYEANLIDKKNKRVVSFWGKSSRQEYPSLKRDLDLATATYYPIAVVNNRTQPIAKFTSPHIQYEGETIKLDIPPNKLVWGRFYPEVPFQQFYYQQMKSTEVTLDHKFEFIMSYKNFPSNQDFPKKDIEKVYKEKRVFMLSLQPFTPDLSWIAIPEIIAGEHDSKIREWAEGVRDIKEPMFIRPLNEMNGDWDPWCAWFYGKDTDLFIKAWQHIVDIFREVKADNAYFVWNPHDRSFPDFTWNNQHLYYPGDDYVDWVGLTGYNNGTSYQNDEWREFDHIYMPLYRDYLIRYGEKPFMITEFSSNEVGGNKAEWIRNGFKSLAENYSNIKIVTWFDGQDGPWQYQINSSLKAQEAFREAIKHPNFLKDSAVHFLKDLEKIEEKKGDGENK